MLEHFGKKGERPADKEILIASIQALIDSFRAPCERGYWQGEEAYKKWIHRWDKVSNDGTEWRTEEIRLLNSILKDEAKCVELAKQKINT